MTENTTQEKITVKGTIYLVVNSFTPKQMEEKGMLNVANMMRTNRVARQLFLQRPEGEKIYHCNEYSLSAGIIDYSTPYAILSK